MAVIAASTILAPLRKTPNSSTSDIGKVNALGLYVLIVAARLGTILASRFLPLLPISWSRGLPRAILDEVPALCLSISVGVHNVMLRLWHKLRFL